MMTTLLRPRLLSVFGVLLLAATAARAADPAPQLWSADPAKSTLTFQFVQAGAKTTGRFARFNANVDFSATNLAQGRIDVAVDMGSADTRDKDRDSTLKTPDLFDVAKFARSTYLATKFTAKGTGFEGQGKLTLRGVTHDVPISFTFVPGVEAGKPVATLKGTATVKRLAFGVGQGEWKSTEWVSDEVQVNFSLLLRPRAAAPAIPVTPKPAQSK